MRSFLLIAIVAFASGAAGSQPAEGAVRPRRSTVTLDVKDADVREVLKSMQKQCGIKNMVIDKEVGGQGATFLFRDVPCETAFKVVLRSYGLDFEPHPNSVMIVEKSR